MTEKTRWLSIEQQAVWRLWLAGTAKINRYLEADLRKVNLNLGEYEVLVRLSESPDGQLRMAELADQVYSSRSKLTHTITRMEHRGLVKRCSECSDGRGVNAVLTEQGWALLEQTAPAHVEAVRRILVDAVDPDDYKALGRVMKAVLAVAD